MKVFSLILALLFAFPQTQNSRIETSYDRFADTTTISLTERIPELSAIVDLGGGSYYVPPGASSLDVVHLHVIAVCKGKTLDCDPVAMIALTSRSRDWIYLKQTNTLRMILNGSERVSFGEMARTNSDVRNGGVSEQIAIQVPLSALRKLSQSQKVEVQIGRDEFELSADFIKDLKELVSRFSVRS